MNVQEIKKTPRPRYCGILVHPTSFPSPYGIGDLGDGAYAFIDFLYDAGQTLWQCLPLGPTGFGDSPYQAFSAFAGQPLLISPDLLLKDGLLEKDDLADIPDFNNYSVEYGNVITYKTALLTRPVHILLHRKTKLFIKLSTTSAALKRTGWKTMLYLCLSKICIRAAPGMNGSLSIRFWMPEPGKLH